MTARRVIPTERLTNVLNEALIYYNALVKLQDTLRLTVKNWPTTPPEASLLQLEAALAETVPPIPKAIAEALGHLKANGANLRRNRERVARRRRTGNTSTYEPIIHEDGGFPTSPTPDNSGFTIEEVEKLIAGLD